MVVRSAPPKMNLDDPTTKYALRVDVWFDGGLTAGAIDLPAGVRLSIDRGSTGTTQPAAAKQPPKSLLRRLVESESAVPGRSATLAERGRHEGTHGMTAEGNTLMPTTGRVVQLVFGAALLCFAYFLFAKAFHDLSQGSVDVYSKSARRIVHLRGWSAYSFAAGILVLAVALTSIGVALVVACRTGAVRNPLGRRLIRAGLIGIGVMVVLCASPLLLRSL